MPADPGDLGLEEPGAALAGGDEKIRDAKNIGRRPVRQRVVGRDGDAVEGGDRM